MEALCKMTPSELRRQKICLPMKLYAVLCLPEFENIVAWLPHGRAWKILNVEGFVEYVLPLFLTYESTKENHFYTFILLLETWGFRQFTKGPDTAAFYNEMFVRAQPSLVLCMRPSDVNEQNTLHDPSSEPNFYGTSISQELTKSSQGQHTIPDRCASQPLAPYSNMADHQGSEILLQRNDTEVASFLSQNNNIQMNVAGYSNGSFQANSEVASLLSQNNDIQMNVAGYSNGSFQANSILLSFFSDRFAGDRSYIQDSTIDYSQRASLARDVIPSDFASLLYSVSDNMQTSSAPSEMTRTSATATGKHESTESNTKTANTTPAAKFTQTRVNRIKYENSEKTSAEPTESNTRTANTTPATNSRKHELTESNKKTEKTKSAKKYRKYVTTESKLRAARKLFSELPPLGSGSLGNMLLTKTQQSTGSLVLPSSPGLTNDIDRAACQWICDNAESFACLSGN